MRTVLVALILSAGCTGTIATVDEGKPIIRIGGSDSLTTKLVPALATTHKKERNTLEFEVTGGGSAAGFDRLLDGDLNIAASSRAHTPAEEEQASENGYSLNTDEARHIVGVDVVAVSVHPSNPTVSLTYDQVIGIFCTKQIDNWSFLGQEDQPIRAIARDPNSGTRALFEDFFCGPRGIHSRVEVAASVTDLEKALAEDKTAISFMSMSEQLGKIVGLRPDTGGQPIQPSQQNIIRGSYPLYRDVYFYTAGPAAGNAGDFITWVKSPSGQEVVDEARFVPLFLRPERLDEPRPLRETIHFEVGSPEPNQRSGARLQLLTDELRERAGEFRHVVLEGYTDNREPDATALSQARAEKVKELLSAELPGLYFEIIPRGVVNPIAPNDTPYGRQRNRRVQIYLAEEEKAYEDDRPEDG